MPSLSQEQFEILKEAYEFANEIKSLQEPLTKHEITHLRKLITKHIGDGYTNYLRLVSVYSIDRDKYLNIYVKNLYQILLLQEQ